MHQKLTQNAKYAKRMVKVRSKTVAPVLGTLINFLNMKKINSRGIKQANKHILMASMTYNLKKYMKFVVKKPKVIAQVLYVQQGKVHTFLKTQFYELKIAFLSLSFFVKLSFSQKRNLV